MNKIKNSSVKKASLLFAVLLPLSAFADLPYNYDFNNYDNWATQFTAGPSGQHTNTAGAVGGNLVVSSSHPDLVGANNNSRISAYATNTGSDLDFYTGGIAITFSDISIDFTSETGRPTAWGNNRRVNFGITSRNDRFFFSGSTQPTSSIYLFLNDNGQFALAYNRNLAGDPNPPTNMNGPNIIQSFAEAYSTSYESITLTLDGLNWGVAVSFYDTNNQLRSYSYSGLVPTSKDLWDGTGDKFYLSVGVDALNGFGAETSSISIGSIGVTQIPEPSSFAFAGVAAVLCVALAVKRRR